MESKSKMNAHKMLEDIQKKYLELKGLDKPSALNGKLYVDIVRQVLGKDDVSAEISALEKKVNGMVLNTKYQDPYTYSILFDIIQAIEEIKGDIFSGLDLNIEMPYFGSVDFDMFSAEICSSECNDKLIIISDGLFTFANLISKIVVQLFPMEEKDGIQHFSADLEAILNYIENNPEIKLRFFDLMLACLITREPPRARQYALKFDLNDFLSIIRSSFEIFVVAHEYSHSVLGHLDNKNINYLSKFDTIEDSDLKQIFHNWDDEIQADLYGTGLALGIMKKRGIDLYLSMLGIIVCTNSFKLFEKIESFRMGKTNERNISTTHPPGFVREKIIIQKYFGKTDIKLFDMIDKIFESLWEDFTKVFLELQSFFENNFHANIYDIRFAITQNLMYRIFEK